MLMLFQWGLRIMLLITKRNKSMCFIKNHNRNCIFFQKLTKPKAQYFVGNYRPKPIFGCNSLIWRDIVTDKKPSSAIMSRVKPGITWPSWFWPWLSKCPYALFRLITFIWSYIKGFMTENRSYDYIQGQGHLGHVTPRKTRLVIVNVTSTAVASRNMTQSRGYWIIITISSIQWLKVYTI